MPTVLRIDGLSVIIYPNDHRPAHVHVKGAENEALFYLACPDGPASPRGNYGFSLAALRKIEAALNAHLPKLCAAWKEMHDLY